MSHHPYRLRSAMSLPALSGDGACESVYGFGEALAVDLQDSADGAAAPFAATAGALAALAGLPRRGVPGVRGLDAGFFDVTSEAEVEGSAETVDLGAIVDGQDRAVGAALRRLEAELPLGTEPRQSASAALPLPLRVQVDDAGQPWFNASDVCDVLEMGNPSQAIKSHVDAEDLQKLETLTPGGRQRQNHVNESGLYALILGSTKEAAKRFKRWVTSEVLPSIRKTGSYAVPALAALPAPTQDRVTALLLIGDAVAKVPGVKAGIAIQLSGGIGPDGIAQDSMGRLLVAHLQIGVWHFDLKNRPIALYELPEDTMTTNLVVRENVLYVTDSVRGRILTSPIMD